MEKNIICLTEISEILKLSGNEMILFNCTTGKIIRYEADEYCVYARNEDDCLEARFREDDFKSAFEYLMRI